MFCSQNSCPQSFTFIFHFTFSWHISFVNGVAAIAAHLLSADLLMRKYGGVFHCRGFSAIGEPWLGSIHGTSYLKLSHLNLSLSCTSRHPTHQAASSLSQIIVRLEIDSNDQRHLRNFIRINNILYKTYIKHDSSWDPHSLISPCYVSGRDSPLADAIKDDELA